MDHIKAPQLDGIKWKATIMAKQRLVEKQIMQNLTMELLEDGITIPPLQCSFPLKRHPDSQQLREECNAWVLDRFSHLQEQARCNGHLAFGRDLLVRNNYGGLAGLAYPDGMLSRIRPVFKFIAWLFMLDNILDEPMATGSNFIATEKLVDRVGKVFVHEDGKEEHEEEEEDAANKNEIAVVLVETAREWWREMQEVGMSRQQQERLATRMVEYLEGHKPLVELRVDCITNVERYMETRALVGAWQACAALMDFVVGEEVEEEVLCHPLLVSLRREASNHICWVNDLLSLRKELADGDPMNLVVLTYMHQMEIASQANHTVPPTLQSMVENVCHMVAECDAQCVSLMAQIRGSSLIQKDFNALDHYLHALGYWLSANVCWHFETARYGIGVC